jgi:hypothetical protein
VRIHQKNLAVTDYTTALPERKRASAVVLFVRNACLASIDRNEGTDTTDCLPVQGENGLEQRHAAQEIASLREPSGEGLRRIGNGEGGDGQMVRWVHFVEPDRNACGGVPDEARGHSSVHGRPDGGNGHRRSSRRNGLSSHHPLAPQPGVMSCPCVRLRRITGGQAVVNMPPVVGRDVGGIDAQRFDDLDRLQHFLDLGQPEMCSRLSPRGVRLKR